MKGKMPGRDEWEAEDVRSFSSGDYTLQKFNGSVRCGHVWVATHSNSCHSRLQLALLCSDLDPTASPSEIHLSKMLMMLGKMGFLNQILKGMC